MRWIENLRLKHKLQLAFMIVSLLSVGLFTAQATYNAKQAALAEIDSQLVMASQAYAYILGVDYHDQLPPRNQVNLKQKRQESVRLTEASQAMKVEFLYSYVEHEGNIFYGQSSLTKEQLADPNFDFYLQPNDVPTLDPRTREVMRSRQPSFADTTSQYGHFRGVLYPVVSPKGKVYVVGSDIQSDIVDQKIQQAIFHAVASGGVVLVAALLISLWLGNVIARPLQKLRDMVHSLTAGHGDLTIQLQIDSKDEIGDIARHFNTFMGQLRQMFVMVRDETSKLTQGTATLEDMAKRLADDSATQSDMASSTAATIEQITTSINLIASHTHDAEKTVQATGQQSATSAAEVANLAGQIHGAANAVDDLAGVMNELDQRAEQIHSVINVIRDIADQTNLLALNAAIEAARAGEQGRGFAVVADEVRKLAERTGQATVEITQTISTMREHSRHALGKMQATHDSVKAGADMASVVSEKILVIQRDVLGVVQQIEEISLSAREQSAATVEMAQSAEQISSMAQAGKEALQDAKAVIHGLNQFSHELQDMVGRFKL